MWDFLGRDVQSVLMLALQSISDLQTPKMSAERGDRLVLAFEHLGFMLRNSRYDFIEVLLTEKTTQGKVVLRG
jgi:hypothetical protein